MSIEAINFIEKKIKENIKDAQVYAFSPDGKHFEALVISAAFVGKSLVAQHQMVMNPFLDELRESLHALGLKTFTPEKWEKARVNYNL